MTGFIFEHPILGTVAFEYISFLADTSVDASDEI